MDKIKKIFSSQGKTSPVPSRTTSPVPSRTPTPSRSPIENNEDYDFIRYKVMIEVLENSGFLEKHVEKQKSNIKIPKRKKK